MQLNTSPLQVVVQVLSDRAQATDYCSLHILHPGNVISEFGVVVNLLELVPGDVAISWIGDVNSGARSVEFVSHCNFQAVCVS